MKLYLYLDEKTKPTDMQSSQIFFFYFFSSCLDIVISVVNPMIQVVDVIHLLTLPSRLG